MRGMDGITDETDINVGKFWEMVRNREAWHAAVHGVAELYTAGWLNNNNDHPTKESFWSRVPFRGYASLVFSNL